ncbi:DNA repair protein RecN [Flavobacteriaceae bacterium]|nr:DNA repair protein RecN [Flavobacteriaceae bacterium]MDC1542804.1 DNA repair protein RecN [Flavobacteriaceae bacterium]
MQDGNKSRLNFLEYPYLSSKFLIRRNALLTHLEIQNFALIEHLEVSFLEGMTCITGETGAGKSILLGGLSLVLGKRAEMSSLLDPSKKCVIEATFDLKRYDLEPLFSSLDLEYDNQTLLRREILPQGKSRAFINDSPVSLNILQQIGSKLIDIHSQNETQSLLESEHQFEVLDALAENNSLLIEFEDCLLAFKKTTKDYTYWSNLKSQSLDSLELKQFLFDELNAVELRPSQYSELEAKIATLSHVEYLQSNLGECIQLLENETTGVFDQTLRLNVLSQGLSKKSDQFSSLNERMKGMSVEIEDLLDECKMLLENLESNPIEMEQLQAELDQLNGLFQKHKVLTVDELIEVKSSLEKELQETFDIEDKLNRLLVTKDQLETKLKTVSQTISQNRMQAAKTLEEELKSLVGKMGMPDAVFRIDLNPSPEFLLNGTDVISFQFSPNKGSQFNLLKKTASGGELSRIMLGVKFILSRYKKLPTLIFDEIDTGVSGKISDSVADLMIVLAQKLQVLTITHLPQVAAKGNHHFKVQKVTSGTTTRSQLIPLSKAERIEEIAMMLSGNQITPTAIAHAKQLMN